MTIFRPWQKQVYVFKNIGVKLYENLWIRGTHYLYILIVSELEKLFSSKRWKSNKNKFEDYIHHENKPI